jgi:hypothetical protein
MDVTVYPQDYKPFKVFATAPYDCIVLVKDRCSGSSVYIHTHRKGLEYLIEQAKNALSALDGQ